MLSFFECIPGFQSLSPIILHLAQPEQRDEHLAAMAEADLILAQNTANTFRIPYLRSADIKANYPNSLIWPNVFYSGQQPFLKYFTHRDQGRMMGPLEALHDLRIYHQWGRERGIFDSSSVNETDFAVRVQQRSLSQLRERETNCDVRISDYIHQNLNHKQLFFTFNHPTRAVLSELAARIAGCLDLQLEITSGPEALDRYIVPSLLPDEARITEGYQGDDYELDQGGMVRRLPGQPRRYSPAELLQAFYEVYDHNPAFRDPDNIRFTPDFDFDQIFSANDALPIGSTR